jgi:hypothetical protein
MRAIACDPTSMCPWLGVTVRGGRDLPRVFTRAVTRSHRVSAVPAAGVARAVAWRYTRKYTQYCRAKTPSQVWLKTPSHAMHAHFGQAYIYATKPGGGA